jgi:hypothetical protein
LGEDSRHAQERKKYGRRDASADDFLHEYHPPSPDLNPFSKAEQVSVGRTADLDQWFASPYDSFPERRAWMIIPHHSGIAVEAKRQLGEALWKTRSKDKTSHYRPAPRS